MTRRRSAHRTALVWFRRDLRLTDNAALLQALEQAEHVVPAFVSDETCIAEIGAPAAERPWAAGAASRWWLHHSLLALESSIEKSGSRLIVQRGPSLPAIRKLVQDTGATLVCWNKLFEPAALEHDAAVAKALQADGVSVEQCNSTLLFEPGAVLNGQQLPYRVFTPFWRAV